MSELIAAEATRVLFGVLPEHRWIPLRQTSDTERGVAYLTGLKWTDVDKLLLCAEILVDGKKGVEVDSDALSNVFGPNSSLQLATKGSIVDVGRGEPVTSPQRAQPK